MEFLIFQPVKLGDEMEFVIFQPSKLGDEIFSTQILPKMGDEMIDSYLK